MDDWNVVVSVREGGYRAGRQLLEGFGRVGRTAFYNVLVMRVPDPRELLDALRETGEGDPEALRCLSHITPVSRTFSFQAADEFEDKLRDAARDWGTELAGKSFHARMHRRGFKGKLRSDREEKLLADALLEAARSAGAEARVAFDDPDAVVVMETLDNRAGLSLLRREDLQRYPFLRPD